MRTKSLNTVTLLAVISVGRWPAGCALGVANDVGVISVTETISDTESSGRIADWLLEFIVGGDNVWCDEARKIGGRGKATRYIGDGCRGWVPMCVEL